jgi:adenylyltransferase/sulfurtransferase
VDRDYVQMEDLHRQALYTEADARSRQPKAVAAGRALGSINSEVRIEPRVADADAGTLPELLEGIDAAVDGTDNLETRFLLNEVCISRGIPWVFGAAVGTRGLCLPVLPGEGPCLRCIVQHLPPPGSIATCETVGVLPPLTRLIAAVQATAVLQILLRSAELKGILLSVDLWHFRWEEIAVARNPSCLTCVQRRFSQLDVSQTMETTTLCGRQAFQVKPSRPLSIPLADLARRLAGAGEVLANEYLLGLRTREAEITVFPDGRAIIKGARSAAEARAIYARFIGT